MDLQQSLHQHEYLEAEIRQLRQALRTLSEAAIAGDADLYELAVAAVNLLDDV